MVDVHTSGHATQPFACSESKPTESIPADDNDIVQTRTQQPLTYLCIVQNEHDDLQDDPPEAHAAHPSGVDGNCGALVSGPRTCITDDFVDALTALEIHMDLVSTCLPNRCDSGANSDRLGLMVSSVPAGLVVRKFDHFVRLVGDVDARIRILSLSP